MICTTYIISSVTYYLFIRHDLYLALIVAITYLITIITLSQLFNLLLYKFPLFFKKTVRPYQLYGYWYKNQISDQFGKILNKRYYSLEDDMSNYDIIELQLFNQFMFIDVVSMVTMMQTFFKDNSITLDDWIDLDRRVNLQKRFLNSISFLKKIELVKEELVYFDKENKEQKILGTL